MNDRSRFPGTILLLVTSFAARLVGATPLPNPPFLSGGSVPPDAATAKVEEGVATFSLQKDAAALQACVVTLMRKLAAASAAGDAAAGAAAEAAYAVCVSADVQKASAYQPVGPLPACLSLAAVHGTMANYVQIALAHLFCDGAAVVHGQYHVPPDPASATRSAALAKLVAKFATRHVHCAISYTHRLVKAGGDAAIADLARAAYDRCYAVARFASEQAVLRLDAGSSPPPCQSESSLLGEQVDVQAKVLAIAFCAP